ncbi:MAG: AraC family ligand binding domain-containing protein [Candidatus Corynebacterium faecigallinarum]|uniref:AraC family ligand binding domain-containing protein n=1 Tax=Candidatus Corynebacterium faecigallinarum TaxID=2838528 RepID=UPI003FB9C94F
MVGFANDRLCRQQTYNEPLSPGGPVVRSLAPCWLGTVTVHSDNHLYYVVRGRARVLVDGSAYDLREGDALWIPPGIPVNQIATDRETVAFTVLLPSTDFRTLHPQPCVGSSLVRWWTSCCISSPAGSPLRGRNQEQQGRYWMRCGPRSSATGPGR